MSRLWKKAGPLAALAILLFISGLMPAAHAESDVTSQLTVTKGRLLFDRGTNTSYLDISLQNTSSNVFLTPIKVVVTNIIPASVTVNNATGQTDGGQACFSIGTNHLPDGQLDPGDSIAAIKIAFNNSSRLRFTFDLKVLALLPTPESAIERMTDALESNNKAELVLNLSAAENAYFQKKLDQVPHGALIHLSRFLKDAILVEETDRYRKYETQITLPTGEVVTTDFRMVLENGAWRLSEL